MSRKICTKVVTGTGTAYMVEKEDPKRTYMGLYAQSGACDVSFGATADHTANTVNITEGNILELTDVTSQVNFKTNGSILVILTDWNSKHLLMSDNIPLTSDSKYLYYTGNAPNRLLPPVFS